ncbi:MAG: zinc ribbon domain-containing protein [Candidatus Tectomicrobia bacterium]|nr:zinc ribbon domain-containing protein [Candidatus Tectomicrobia bacterium]
MPIYEYRCAECSAEFEKMQKFSDAPVSSCPHCGGAVHKLISHSTFHLKGSGWYVTDYAKKSSSAPSPSKSENSEKARASSSDASPSSSSPSSSTASSASDD